jgi:hypothetical protein
MGSLFLYFFTLYIDKDGERHETVTRTQYVNEETKFYHAIKLLCEIVGKVMIDQKLDKDNVVHENVTFYEDRDKMVSTFLTKDTKERFVVTITCDVRKE